LRCRNPPRHSKWARTLPFGIFHRIFKEFPPPIKSVKDLSNTFDFNPKLTRNVPCGIFHGIFKETPPPKNFFLIDVEI
jgi:hypothetical protein